VHQIVFLLWFEWITPRKVVQRTVDELEIPRIPEVDLVRISSIKVAVNV
jgi:hypothetical protein